MDAYFVYILTNHRNSVLYTGFTSNLVNRVYHHKKGLIKGFTKKYNVHKLVYFETFDDKTSASKREKQIKDSSRRKKLDLIERVNKDWHDLYKNLK